MTTQRILDDVDENLDDYYSHADLRRRGWSVRMIHQLLRGYDRTTRHTQSMSSTRLYYRDRVEQAEKWRAFVRGKARIAAAIARVAQAADELRAVEISIEPLEFAELQLEAVEAWRKERGHGPGEPLHRQVILRVMVRHAVHRRARYTNREPAVAKLGQQGTEDALRWKVLELVADQWPELSDEAERQAWEHSPDGAPAWMQR